MRMLELDAPEFFVNAVGKVERLGSCIRLTMCLKREDVMEPRYVCIWPIDCLLERNALVALIGAEALGEAPKH